MNYYEEVTLMLKDIISSDEYRMFNVFLKDRRVTVSSLFDEYSISFDIDESNREKSTQETAESMFIAFRKNTALMLEDVFANVDYERDYNRFFIRMMEEEAFDQETVPFMEISNGLYATVWFDAVMEEDTVTTFPQYIQVTNNALKMMGVSSDRIFGDLRKSLMADAPIVSMGLDEWLNESEDPLMDTKWIEAAGSGLFLSDYYEEFGSGIVAYDNFFDYVRSEIGKTDFYMLPVDQYSVFVIPADRISEEDARAFFRYMSKQIVISSRISKNIYFCDHQKETFEMK